MTVRSSVLTQAPSPRAKDSYSPMTGGILQEIKNRPARQSIADDDFDASVRASVAEHQAAHAARGDDVATSKLFVIDFD